MTTPELFPAQEPQPEQDPFAADRAFHDVCAALAGFEVPADDKHFTINDVVTPEGKQRNINVMSGDGTHAIATSVFPGEASIILVTVKGAPANGKSNIEFMFAPPQVALMLHTGWDAQEERSVVYMQVDRGPHYGPKETKFMQDTGLSEICPDECVQAIEPNGVYLYEVEPSTLASLIEAHTKAAKLPAAV